MTHTRKPALGFVLVLAGASMFIVNAGVSRVALRSGVDPVALTTIRVTGTALVLLVSVTVAATFYAGRRLQTLRITEA